MRKFSLVAVLVVMFTIPFPTSAQAACSQSAKVSGGSVTLCLSITKPSTTPSSSTKAVTSVRTPTSTVATPACPGWVTDLVTWAKFVLRGCPPPRLVAPAPKPVATTTVKTTTTLKTTNSVQSDQAAFSPDPLLIVAPSTEFSTGETVLLSSTAGVHERTSALLGSPAQVRFVPVAYRWRFDGNPVAATAVATIRLSTSGSHIVELEVDYEASYRFDLSAPFADAGTITVSASTSLHATTPVPIARTPHLVSGSCAAHPSSYRC